MKRVLLAMVFLSACRTEIAPVVREQITEARRVRANGECMVNDYRTPTDLPPKAKDLGPVKVSRQETDEATIELLRKQVCKMGGDALTGTAWVRAAGASLADPPIELEGNAWRLP
jgi:hypothetical protein